MRVRSHARTGATTLVAFGMVAAGLVGASSAHAASVETTVSSLNAGAETSPEPEGVMTLPENTMTEDPPSADEDITLERSEEHTSELQSRGHLVCRLLLEQKK